MGKMFMKPGPFGDTYLYDGNGKLVGRGFPDSYGITRFTGTDGKYMCVVWGSSKRGACTEVPRRERGGSAEPSDLESA